MSEQLQFPEKKAKRRSGTGTIFERKNQTLGSRWAGELKSFNIRVYGATYEEVEQKLAKEIELLNNRVFKKWSLIKDCVDCDNKKGSRGQVKEVGNHVGLYCKCGRWQKWIPRTEAGYRKRSLKRSGVPLKIRFKILDRDNSQCVMCGNKPPDTTLHIDHIIPVVVAREQGWDREQINSLTNLQTLCQECNLGKGRQISNFIYNRPEGSNLES